MNRECIQTIVQLAGVLIMSISAFVRNFAVKLSKINRRIDSNKCMNRQTNRHTDDKQVYHKMDIEYICNSRAFSWGYVLNKIFLCCISKI